MAKMVYNPFLVLIVVLNIAKIVWNHLWMPMTMTNVIGEAIFKIEPYSMGNGSWSGFVTVTTGVNTFFVNFILIINVL